MIKFELSAENKLQLENQLRTDAKQLEELKQALRQQEQKFQAEKEQIFLELLEVFDTLEYPIDYLKNNPEVSPQFIKRLPKSLAAIQQKLSIALARQQVTPIALEDTTPDFSYCQVVGREDRTDLADQTITKIVRQGFRYGDKILRPVEIITAKN
ncbi:nucleotide exchange factor GrpE [Chamaesiphon polymorphus CCALA 037]|uniref:Nucleotide exchange factor GrpE n=2 Tax=Chamaesiphon TaxID=217161 RepID=A0A2T1G706_9CYAN|nr:nucleotide exchange factor GrpE [Chamaesiphon polymorphus CCALA 037]